ncbi:hypothetical protein J422_04483 [Methanocaldococcus villosus KIN24-T80]|uniref:Uncharacterized protein n=1 Tax=Methanocaldococcus villosus KIN24-T80 TaxID=1069083 RepID=N6UUS8_9EURY|nr:hypothetical protein J422_04483 [Methanocaldococcus villosus KIN24-T80]
MQLVQETLQRFNWNDIRQKADVTGRDVLHHQKPEKIHPLNRYLKNWREITEPFTISRRKLWSYLKKTIF